MATAITTNAAIDRVIELLDTDIDYLGIGTGASAITVNSTLLDNETQRKAATKTIDGNVLIVEGYWDDTEGNGSTYTEAGCFCDGATVTVDTGTLFTGGQVNVAKDNTQSLTVSIEITVEAVNT